MPNPEEAREEAWRENHDRLPSQSVVESSWRRAGFRDGWEARGRYDEQRIGTSQAVRDAWAQFQTIIGLSSLRAEDMPHPDGAIHKIEERARAEKIVESAVRADDKREDGQRVAELKAWVEDALNTGDIGLVLYERGEALLRAIGQSEEVKP